MKRSLWKRIGAVTLAIAVSLTMGVTSFAETNLDGGKAGSADNPAGNSVTLEKAIKVTNHEGTNANAPDVTYTYTLSEDTAEGSVNDGTTTAKFKAGKISYLASGSAAEQTVTFAKSESTTSGQSISKDLTWTFDPAAFPSAGVYRYVVTETANPADVSTIGIDRPTAYDTSKYLDVYVQNTASGLQIYGYVLVDDDSTVTSSSAKSEGWKSGDDLDAYDTYNITITNTIDGTGADLTAEFPFEVALSGELSHAAITVGGTGEVGYDATTHKATGTLGNGETLVINGLPKTALFSVTETNPTSETYQLTSEATGIDGATTVEDVDVEGGKPGNVLTGGDISKTTGAVAINVTNHLGSISPTNVVMRFAPFLFIFGAAILLLVVMRRRRTHDAE